MKKLFLILSLLTLLFALNTVPAGAAVNDVVKVGLRYGGSAVSSANLENAQGGGFAVGYYDDQRNFTALGTIGQTTVTITPADALGGTFDQSGPYGSFDGAAAASPSGGWVAYSSGGYYARWSGGGNAHTATAVAVTASGSSTILFEFDSQGIYNLGVRPSAGGNGSAAWFKGYRYAGGFEYPRVTGGGLYVVNVVTLEEYVKGVIPYEMSTGWPAAALEAQSVCVRTYVCKTTKHLGTYGFDVCNTTDCQVYNGIGSNTSHATADTDAAVDATAGQKVYYNGELVETVYHASDGGATEDAANVWGSEVGYLLGKADPYEAGISIPDYAYTVTYTPTELTWVLQNSGYSIGTVKSVSVTERTAQGNVYKVSFVDTTGKTLTVKGEACRMAFYSTTYGKSVRSMRFSINGQGPSSYYVNGFGSTLGAIRGAYTISGSGAVTAYSGAEPYAITSAGTSALTSGVTATPDGNFTITGTGNGHNVGLSQYGARAMAEQGKTYREILNFYYTNVTIG